MFNKLKNRFTLIQLVTISIVLIASFTFIYLNTKSDIENRIDGSFEQVHNGAREIMNPDDTMINRQNKETFVVYYSSNSDILYETNSDLTEEEVWSIHGDILATNEVIINGEQWEYRSYPGPEGLIILINVSVHYGILSSLTNTLFINGLLVIVVMAVISRIFSNNAIKPIEESYKKQKEFVSDASHELRTPLAIMNSNLDILLSDADISEDERINWLRLLKEEVKNMTNLSNDLLFLTSNKNINTEEIDLSSMLNSKLLMFDAVFYENEIKAEVEVTEDIVVEGIPTQISQLFTVLLDNAIKYSNDRIVNITLSKRSTTAQLKVSNRTEDVNEENIANLFNRFYKVDTSRNQSINAKSYGLGLSLAKSIVKKHNGKIKADIEEDIFTVTVSIPLK